MKEKTDDCDNLKRWMTETRQQMKDNEDDQEHHDMLKSMHHGHMMKLDELGKNWAMLLDKHVTIEWHQSPSISISCHIICWFAPCF